MKRFAPIALALMATVASAAPSFAQGNAPGVNVGTLTCLVKGKTNFIIGSSATLGCNYKPVAGGPVEYYKGTIDDFGVNIGTAEDATLVWGVLAPSADMKPGVLAGNYGGVTAGASLGVGLKANALIGGLDKSIALNPLSVETQTGANITLGVAKLKLEPIN